MLTISRRPRVVAGTPRMEQAPMIADRFQFVIASALIFGFAGATAFGENEVGESKIIFGRDAALVGPAQG